MAPRIFINYRRDDTASAAQAVYTQLGYLCDFDQVFMDVHTIRTSQPWPERIRAELERASALIVLIGDKWLHVHDEFGRRRIDRDDDWLRLEISTALRLGKKIYPVVIGHDFKCPPPEALPKDIARFGTLEATSLSHDHWIRDITAFANVLEQDGVMKPSGDSRRSLPLPNPDKARLPALTEQELDYELSRLGGWAPWRERLLLEYPHERRELRRQVWFDGFTSAMKFMREAARLFKAEKHHPRWSNEWNLVTIRLTTWDAGNRVTARDVDVAAKLNTLIEEFSARRRLEKKKSASKPDSAATVAVTDSDDRD